MKSLRCKLGFHKKPIGWESTFLIFIDAFFYKCERCHEDIVECFP